MSLLRNLRPANCLDVLMRLHAEGGFPTLVNAARTLVQRNVREVTSQPLWATFEDKHPRQAIALLKVAATAKEASASSPPPTAHSEEQPVAEPAAARGGSRKRARASGGGLGALPY